MLRPSSGFIDVVVAKFARKCTNEWHKLRSREGRGADTVHGQ